MFVDIAYDPTSKSGLRWLAKKSSRVNAGDQAGTLGDAGYWYVKLGGRRRLAHRVVVALCDGIAISSLDGLYIDHLDGNRTNNCRANLRVTTARGNQQNRAAHRAGKLVGCHFCNTRKKWIASIYYKGKLHHLGICPSEQEAHALYLNAVALVEAGLWH